MLPVAKRAIIIGLLGPAIQGVGLLWTTLHLAFSHWSSEFGTRHLIYEPSVLLIVVGFAVAVVCVPVAIEVARASEEDVDIPVYAPQPSERGGDGGNGLTREFGRLARYSSGTGHQTTGPDRQAR
jgi:hypothetical protein